MSDEVTSKIIDIIAEQAMMEPGEISPESSLEELGLDSLALVEVVFGIEESFDVSVPFNANDPSESDFDITNVQSIVDGVKKLIADKENA
ncbi:acyl carrier protein [Rhodobacteraceae bacterium NNCM2]|nr:acyl carrier protein [Coraliihabitans acroporae]